MTVNIVAEMQRFERHFGVKMVEFVYNRRDKYIKISFENMKVDQIGFFEDAIEIIFDNPTDVDRITKLYDDGTQQLCNINFIIHIVRPETGTGVTLKA